MTRTTPDSADSLGPSPRPAHWRRRIAVFAAISVGLHLIALLIIQTLGLRQGPTVMDEPIPVELVELLPPPPDQPAPQAPAQVQEEPPTPEPPDEPEPEPEPEQQAETEPEPEPEPTPEPEPQQPQQQAEAPAPQAPAEVIAPEDEEGEAGVQAIPGLRYRGGRGDSAMSAFLHAVECASINIRYEEYCSDIGPIYLAENPPERITTEAERIFRQIYEEENSRVAPTGTGACESPLAGGNLTPGACVSDSGPRLRDVLD